MDITIAYLKAAFNKYNEEIFGNTLPIPNLRVSNAKQRLGSMSYRIQRVWEKHTVASLFRYLTITILHNRS